MRINHNLMALTANRYLATTGTQQQTSLEKISSGLRINSASDDAAGLAISEKMRAQISGLEQAESNAQDGISLIQTAEGALSETHSILQRMRELAVQSSNDTNTSNERAEMQKEVDELAKELTRIANNTEFNNQKLINGGMEDGKGGSIKFHIGANTGQDISLSIGAMDAESLGVSRGLTTSATATADGDILSVAFSGESFGAGIVDGAVITTSYADASAGSVATWEDIDIAASAGDKEFTFNGVTITVTDGAAADATVTGEKSVTIGVADASAQDAVRDAIITAVGAYQADTITADGSLDAFTFGNGASNDQLTISTNKKETTYNALEATGTAVSANGTIDTEGAFATPAKVILTSDQGHSQVIDIEDTTATSLVIGTGDFKGMTISMNTGDSKTLADLNGDSITVTSATSGAAAAVFENGEFVSEAVVEAGIDISTQEAASNAITVIDEAITMVSGERSKLGAYQNRLEHTIASLSTTSENTIASESRIRDVDIAEEMMNYTKLNILQQAAQSMLAQANQAPQGVLKLLG